MKNTDIVLALLVMLLFVAFQITLFTFQSPRLALIPAVVGMLICFSRAWYVWTHDD